MRCLGAHTVGCQAVQLLVIYTNINRTFIVISFSAVYQVSFYNRSFVSMMALDIPVSLGYEYFPGSV